MTQSRKRRFNLSTERQKRRWPGGAAGLGRLDSALARAAGRISALRGRARALAAVACGVAAALAFAPFYVLPLMAAGFSVFMLLLDGAAGQPRPKRAAFVIGWFFGFGFFLVGLYWLAFSFFVQAEEFAWMAPFAVLGMPAFLGLFWGGAAALFMVMRRDGWRRIVAFAAVFMVFEFARGHVLTGLPWNLPAQALAGTAMGAQTAAWIGPYGLSLVVVALAVFPAAFVREGRVLAGTGVMLAGVLMIFALGAARLAGPEASDRPEYVRIIQPNIPQREKIDFDLWERNFLRQLDMSRGPVSGPTYVIWPENASALIDEAQFALEALSEALPPEAILVVGAVRREMGADGRLDYFNALSVIEETGSGRRPVAYYDKHHLVPFGEYLPLQGFLRAVGLAQLAPYDEGFAAGPGPQTIEAGGTAFSPLICYEAIFPGAIHPRDQRPDWLAAVTNDAWFGDTSGPRQHLDQARLRAIETGLPMARAANTGVSALIDAKGRLLTRVRLYEAGRIDAPLPGALAPTLYSRVGDAGFLFLALVALFLGGRGRDGDGARGPT